MATTRRELAPRYDAAAVEPAIYDRWLAADAFRPADQPRPGAEPFVIIQPPPNVTGALHLGHALTAFVEDILIRYHRMRGDDTLWLPGVDHASIAAQFVLDRILADEGESRESLGRERYLERMWRFMDETRDVIGDAAPAARSEPGLVRGCASPWTRAALVRFASPSSGCGTPGSPIAARRSSTGVPRCRTTISDLENIQHEETGTLVEHPLPPRRRPDGTPDPDAWISVATTRPETIFGDTAVAVHPDDERYRGLVGREAILPFIGRRLPIVADEHVEREFGTGAVKITPAHDFDDYEVAQAPWPPDDHGPRRGGPAERRRRRVRGARPLRRAPEAILDRLREMGDLEAERPHEMVIGRCDRCGTVVEPRLSVQWFINVKPLAERALASVREGRTRIIPSRFEKVYAHWMENIHDWAVGRQLWWGHRIPAWYCPDGHITRDRR